MGVEFLEANRPAVEALSHLRRALVGPVGHQDRSSALGHQVASRLLTHLSCAYQENFFALERAKYLPRQLHRYRCNRYG